MKATSHRIVNGPDNCLFRSEDKCNLNGKHCEAHCETIPLHCGLLKFAHIVVKLQTFNQKGQDNEG